ncbi:hypothetical protein EJ110_NYTH36575 [Nymphaea thermarum]|nr:hypothetical protein EJ110_NYTH36575 [Nymphaea thermarum]
MEADVQMICNAVEDGGDGVVKSAALSREASALKGPSWASIVEGDKLHDEAYLNEVEIREVDGNKASNEDDLQMILVPGRWKVGGRVLVANRWRPGMPLKLESSSKVRIWVLLPDLQPEVWRNGIFQMLARIMGATFVEADAFTMEVASLGYARVLLEVPLGFYPVNEVRVSFEEGVALVQSIEYESKVRYCRKCGATSHFTFACDDLKQSPSTDTADVEDGKAWMAVKSPKRRSFFLNKMVGPTNEANRFSALHCMPEREEGVNAKEGGTSAAPIPESARRQSMQVDEDYSEVVGHDRDLRKEEIPILTKGAPTASIIQGQQNADSMVIDETHTLPVNALVSHRTTSVEKKRQLKSKSTSSFKKIPTSHTQAEKLFADLYASCSDASLVLPQTTDHSSFGTTKARACPASEDPGDKDMRFLAWNARGLAGATAQHDLQLMLQLAHPDIAVLIDTKLNETALAKLSLKFSRYLSVSNIHLNGQWARIWLLWDADKMQIHTSKVQAHWISIEVNHLSSGRTFSVLGVYLNPDFRIRRFQYDELNAELSSLCKPNVCLGDFNSVRDMSQKTGKPPTLWPCILFNNFIASNHFVEVLDPVIKYSWYNKREGPANVQSLIDHCFVSHDWWDCREWNFSLQILPRTSSDHNPIVMAAERNHIFTYGKSVFRYFNYWEQFPQCANHIADCSNDLVRIIERLRVQVGVTQNQPDSVDLSASSREIKLRLTLLKLIKMDEERLRQKARVRWMKEGDSNSKFFHAMAKGRQRRNHIRTIIDGQRVLSDVDEIFASCTTDFKELLTDNAGSGSLPSNVWPGLTLTDEENDLLVSPIRDEEIQWAVLRAKKDSVAGPDGFNNRFYQTYWSTIGPDELFADQQTYVHMFLDSLSIPVQFPRIEDGRQDILEWVDYGSRALSRHHIWDVLRDSNPTQPWRNAIWNVGAPPRAAWTTYMAVEGRLQVDARAQKHGLYLASRCYICKSVQEDINYVFLHCKEARSLWELVIKKFRQSNFHPLTIKDALVWWTSRKFRNKVLFKCWKNLLHIILWHIWKWRNNCKHGEKAAMNYSGKALWSYCSDFMISKDWKQEDRQAIQTWLQFGFPWGGWRWEPGISHNIHIAVCLTEENRDVAALVRDSSRRYIFGIACWSDAARATDEAWVLQQSLLAVQESDQNVGNIKVICNNGFFINRCNKCFRN